MPDENANLPLWVRRADGSQEPFDADRICQSLYAAAERMGGASAFLIRELTDVVLHFLAQNLDGTIPTTHEIGEEVAKIVREVGQAELARRYVEARQVSPEPPRAHLRVRRAQSVEHFSQASLEEYSRSTIFSPDVIRAVEEGLLELGGLATPTALTTFVVPTPQLAALPWWRALDDWRACGGARWIVDGPEWLCAVHPHPALTPQLCERLLALPTFAEREVELHLNIAEPPTWANTHQSSPLFGLPEDDPTARDRAVFLDSLLERWKTLDTPRVPALAWHLRAACFADENQRRQLESVIRQALQGKAVRFAFDRPPSDITLAEGLDRRSPGVLLEVGLNLSAFADRPEIKADGATLLSKLPSLARMAVSAAVQKRRFLRELPASAPLKHGFLIERGTCVVAPRGLDDAVRAVTAESMTKSPLSLDFAGKIVQTLKATLERAAGTLNLDLRVDGPDLSGIPDAAFAPRKQLETAGILHALAGAGTMTLLLADGVDTNIDTLTDLLHWAAESTGVVRVQLQRAGQFVQQGELAI